QRPLLRGRPVQGEMAVQKRHPPAPFSLPAHGLSAAAAGAAAGLDRDRAMSAAITAAIRILADAQPGEIAVLSACRGAPLCAAQDTASCPLCECVTVSEDGIVGYPGSGRA